MIEKFFSVIICLLYLLVSILPGSASICCYNLQLYRFLLWILYESCFWNELCICLLVALTSINQTVLFVMGTLTSWAINVEIQVVITDISIFKYQSQIPKPKLHIYTRQGNNNINKIINTEYNIRNVTSRVSTKVSQKPELFETLYRLNIQSKIIQKLIESKIKKVKNKENKKSREKRKNGGEKNEKKI